MHLWIRPNWLVPFPCRSTTRINIWIVWFIIVITDAYHIALYMYKIAGNILFITPAWHQSTKICPVAHRILSNENAFVELHVHWSIVINKCRWILNHRSQDERVHESHNISTATRRWSYSLGQVRGIDTAFSCLETSCFCKVKLAPTVKVIQLLLVAILKRI